MILRPNWTWIVLLCLLLFIWLLEIEKIMMQSNLNIVSDELSELFRQILRNFWYFSIRILLFTIHEYFCNIWLIRLILTLMEHFKALIFFSYLYFLASLKSSSSLMTFLIILAVFIVKLNTIPEGTSILLLNLFQLTAFQIFFSTVDLKSCILSGKWVILLFLLNNWTFIELLLLMIPFYYIIITIE